jgi:hypothetical protein
MLNVIHNGKTLTLLQDAYIDNQGSFVFCTAVAQDSKGTNYKVVWPCKDYWQAVELDEVCDWDNYSVTEL